MQENNIINGYSILSRNKKLDLLNISDLDKKFLTDSKTQSALIQEIIEELSENTIANFPFPLGIAPNFVVNGKTYFLPLVTEESSVVAAIAKAAKFWAKNGGFKAEILGTTKKGQVHFFWKGNKSDLLNQKQAIVNYVLSKTEVHTNRMKKRGGGITNINIIDKTNEIPAYFQLDFDFETADAMGANFINTCLEKAALGLKEYVINSSVLDHRLFEINMAILSNYTPESKVKVYAQCPVDQVNKLGIKLGITNVADRFITAISIAKNDISRAVTHNKGIFNGIDAVLLATGNDWRAVEAGAHAYAARHGKYSSLSDAYISSGIFNFELEIPMAVGIVGGVTSLHPIAKTALKILGNPNAKELMMLIAASGLAANFSAITALITTGIQDGHMRMHQSNIDILQKNDLQK